ncbi:MAG TPA: molybdopterin cofactor-binding domain-containing protein, partial [Anaerolineales bacterium]
MANQKQQAQELDDWIAIEPDGTITAFSGKVELGTGVRTALAQIVAEELDVPLARVRMVMGDTALTPDEGYTAGSM